MKDNRRNVLLSFFMISLIFLFLFNSLVFPAKSKAPVSSETETLTQTLFENIEKVDALELIEMLDAGNIKSAIVSQGTIYVSTNDNKTYSTETTINLLAYLKLHGIDCPTVTTIDNPEENTTNPVFSIYDFFILCCTITLGGLMGRWIYRRTMKMQTVVTISQSQNGTVKRQGEEFIVPDVKFEDVEGVEGLKKDLYRIVDCLKNSDKYQKLGGKIPNGVILYGPPGTGKTLIAKAIAGEAGVPFFNAVGSDFIEKYVGVGASRIRELYKKARKYSPCIVFIDEVDAVAGRRGSESNSESDQTVNALLSELDGFKDSEGIITICATNRLDLLDDAFKRSGRFDLKLAVGLPDRDSRFKILHIHGRTKVFSKEVDFHTLAGKTVGFSGADLEALLNEAALIAAEKDKNYIENSDIEDAFFKIVMQGNKKTRSKINEVVKLTAYHEAGHTIVTKLLTGDGVSSVTIAQSSSGAGGVTFRNPIEDGLQSKRYLRNTIKAMYAGRAAEELFLGNDEDITTGASQDIKQATALIKEYIASYGMGDKGLIDITQFSKEFNSIITEASNLSKELYAETLDFLRQNFKILVKLADALIDKETLNETEIDRIVMN